MEQKNGIKMKHSVEEIKKMLAEISPWPWESFEVKGCNCGAHSTHWNVRINGQQLVKLSKSNAGFIAASPEIISDLVDEIEALNTNADDFIEAIQSEWERKYKILRKQNEIYVKALKQYSHVILEGGIMAAEQALAEAKKVGEG